MPRLLGQKFGVVPWISMELLMTKSHMHLKDIKSLTDQNSNRNMPSIRLNLLKKKNLEAQNHRRDTSIPSVCAGFIRCGLCINDNSPGYTGSVNNYMKIP